MIHFSIDPAYRKLNVTKMLKRAVATALVDQKTDEGELTLVLTSDKKLRDMNRRFRGIDNTTDVLSFPSEEKSHPGYLGDIIISVPRAKLQAKAAGHSLMDELTLLVVHGVLHLLGFDHSDRNSKSKMWATQDKILKKLGVEVDVDLQWNPTP